MATEIVQAVPAASTTEKLVGIKPAQSRDPEGTKAALKESISHAEQELAEQELAKRTPSRAPIEVQEQLVFYLVLMELRVPMGRQLVTLPRGKVLHPEHDAHIIETLRAMYKGKQAPLRKLTQDDYSNLVASAASFF